MFGMTVSVAESASQVSNEEAGNIFLVFVCSGLMM